MKVLVIGSGGREHALVWKLHQSPRVKKIYCAPGNAGIGSLATCVAIDATDIPALSRFAGREKIDLTIVGPEIPLTLGIVDIFEKKGLRVFGPGRQAAMLEGSKVFTKKFMQHHDIPSADFTVCRKARTAMQYIEKHGAPLVVKADGLAAGKGAIVCHTVKEAKEAVDLIMGQKIFGAAGRQVVLEDFMPGEEASFLAFTDGKTILPLPTSQDHKAVYDGDRGPNTGGMGAYSPAPVVTGPLAEQVMERIMYPTVRAMAREGSPYKGVLYAGLMISDNVARVVEFNCRFGDPEAQPLLMRLRTDLVDIVEAVIDERLDQVRLEIDPRPSVCVVMAAGGYPGAYQKGKAISGLRRASRHTDVEVFHAGTALKNRRIVSNGGRVLGITALGADLHEAIDRAYAAVADINWAGCYYRKDIGHKALDREGRKGTSGKRQPLVGIVMGSDSDLPVMQAAADFLDTMEIPWEMTIASAHRTPAKATRFATTAAERGLKVIIAGAGMAAHLAGAMAAHTDLPVIGIPLDASPLKGLDALLATVQMPPGIPVATMAVGKAGARNGAVLAARILALEDRDVAARLAVFRRKMADEVEAKDARLRDRGLSA